MADILIRGMEMPTGCASCDFAIYHADSAYHYCFWLKQVFVKPDARLKDCPLHELPEHGDLIDRDANAEVIFKVMKASEGIERHMAEATLKVLNAAPVIVPAEEEAE